jgi:hypothetical protein
MGFGQVGWMYSAVGVSPPGLSIFAELSGWFGRLGSEGRAHKSRIVWRGLREHMGLSSPNTSGLRGWLREETLLGGVVIGDVV